jgi:hypothetical protein
MTIDRAGFLRRWSERKQAAREGTLQPTPAETVPDERSDQAPEEPFDPANLPSIDSLSADSDYTVFLRPGVPEALTNAALRQAWRSDPFISSFKEMADYDWDFNAPGYGALLPTDDVKALLSRVIDRPTPEPESPALASAEAEATKEQDEGQPAEKIVAALCVEPAQEEPSSQEIAAPQHGSNAPQSLIDPPMAVLRRTRHGGALPS